MKTKIPFLIFIFVVLVGFVAFIFSYNNKSKSNESTIPDVVKQGTACTMEAKLCPDGSYVGRQGPKCEFAQCPNTPTTTPSSVTLKAKLGEKVTGLGVSITPLAVTEDSRCPVNVTCIQAGRLVVQGILEPSTGKNEFAFILGQSITTPLGVVTFVSALPVRYLEKNIEKTDYQFVFEIKKQP